MPELPEAEILRRYLEANSLHKGIRRLDIRDRRILENISPKRLEKNLEGSKFLLTERYGKRIFLQLKNNHWLTIHLGMSGWLEHLMPGKSEPSHTRMLIYFHDGDCLAYSDSRMFGRIGLTSSIRSFIKQKNLGPDALEMDLQTYLSVLINRKGAIKASLLDQSIVAGLGNLYSDESLFHASIRPDARGLGEARLKILFNCTHLVLMTAIFSGANFQFLPESFLLSHRYPGGICPVDGTTLMRMKIAGRTSYYCPNHQKL